MEFNAFRTTIINELGHTLSDDYEVVPHDAYKNNSTLLRGICIRRKESPVAPVIYLENAYEEFVAEEIEMRDVIKMILRMKDARAMDNVVVDTVKLFQEWETAKDYVKPRLINNERNQKFLMRTPYLSFHDLSVIFCLEFKLGDNDASITVTDQLLETYGVSVTELYERSLFNLNKEDFQLRTLMETFLDLDAPEEILEEVLDDRLMDMWVLTKADGGYASAAILLPRIRELILNKLKGAAYILPCSRHELIIVPQRDIYEPNKMVQTVKKVNLTLNPADYLADSVYLLNLECELIQVV